MSDNERKDETEVEGHGIPHRFGADDEPAEEGETEVEGHGIPHRFGADDEPAEEGETEVEAHVHRTANVRMDAPSNI
jgi:hypothetical protein